MFNTNVCDLINNNVKKVIAVGVSISNTNTKVPLSNTNSNANISKDKTKVSMLSVLKENQYVQRTSKFMEHALFELTLVASTWYMAYVPLLLIYLSEFFLLSFSILFNIKIALRSVAEMWINYLYLWHNHSVVGLKNIPAEGPGLLVWYHGPLPVDYIGVVARVFKETDRRIYTVTDRCLEILPGLDMFRHHMRVGSFSKVKIAGLLDAGELVGVSPGGARECLFDHDCSVLWNNRTGFAKVANLTQVPIIPIYTENIRVAYQTMKTGSSIWRTIFEKTKLPTTLMYGGFPVQLTTHIGNPIMRRDGESHLQLQSRVRSEVKNLIKANQRETTVMNALTERFPIIKTIKSLTQKQIVLR